MPDRYDRMPTVPVAVIALAQGLVYGVLSLLGACVVVGP